MTGQVGEGKPWFAAQVLGQQGAEYQVKPFNNEPSDVCTRNSGHGLLNTLSVDTQCTDGEYQADAPDVGDQCAGHDDTRRFARVVPFAQYLVAVLERQDVHIYGQHFGGGESVQAVGYFWRRHGPSVLRGGQAGN